MGLLAPLGCERHGSSAVNSGATRITVFAAASTTDVLQEAGRRFKAATRTEVTFSFDASSNLARQIKAGAPADLFISADEKWMDDVAAAGGIRPATREDLLGNELVLIAPAGKRFEVKMARDFDFAAALPQVQRIAVGDPSHVPAGRYARQALEALGWWTGLERRLIPAQDVRAALRLIEMGEADAGIVYATDARQSDKVAVVAAFPTDTHEPVRYPIALCTNAGEPAAAFQRFLRSPEMTTVFEKAGFRVLPPGTGSH